MSDGGGWFTPAGDPRLFRCPCGRPDCEAPPPAAELLARLNVLRDRVGRPVIVTSGPRCPSWNARVGGARTSDHLTGEGADLHVRDSRERDELLDAIYTRPRLFLRIGAGPDFLHVGLPGPERPARVAWTYYLRSAAGERSSKA